MKLFAKIVNGFELRVLRASTISRLFLEFSVKLVFQDSSGKFSHLWCSDFRKIFVSKNWLDFFTYTLQPNISTKLSLSPTNQRKINHSLQVALFRKSVSPSRKGGGGEEETVLFSFFYLLNFRLLIHWELKNFRNVFLKSKKLKNLLLQSAHWKLTRLT